MVNDWSKEEQLQIAKISQKHFYALPFIITAIVLISGVLDFLDLDMRFENKFFLCIFVLAPSSHFLLHLIPFKCPNCSQTVFFAFDHCYECNAPLKKKSIESMSNRPKGLIKLRWEIKKRLMGFAAFLLVGILFLARWSV